MSQADPRFNRLLLIDDEPAIRRMMALDLASDGYEVSTAEDGNKGLELFEAQRPDLVLTDLKMPGPDGLEVLKRIKSLSPDTEVIVITGHGDLELAIKALRLRASDFITKPINSDALDVALERAAHRLRLTAELRSYTEGLENKVREATQRVLAAERLAAVGQAVAGLVHSLKNMLSGLRGGMYLLELHQKNRSQDQLDQGLEMLDRNLKRVKALVHNLLMISKPREPENELADADGLLLEALQCARPQAGDKGVTLLHDNPPGQAQLMLDREMILDALANLISNAIDAAAQSGDGLVSCRLELGRGEATFVIQDNGPGLDPTMASQIFEAFYSSKGAEGTGLGLAVTRKIAQEHGGRVEFENFKDRGAVFRLILPWQQPQIGQAS